MRILSIHNRYQIRGGEDECRDAKVRLLASKGHDVREVAFDNSAIGPRNAALVGLRGSWNRSAYDTVQSAISSWRPDVADIDNFFPVASPSVHFAVRRCGVPLVQNLHNFRLLCPASTLFRKGVLCESCVGKRVPWPGVVHGCYRNSRAASAAVATMLTVHNFRSTWRKQVTLFVALTEFGRQKFIEGGLPADRIAVKPNFVDDNAGPGPGDGNFVLYVGRLATEKGIPLLLRAWTRLGAGRLVVVGDGPLAQLVREAASSSENIVYLGRKPLAEVYKLMGHAKALVFPSLCYEGLPGVIIESFCRGTPVIANRLGSMEHMIRDGQDGWLVEPGNGDALAGVLSRVFAEPERAAAMRSAARTAFELNYTVERNYQMLMDIYQRAIDLNRGE